MPKLVMCKGLPGSGKSTWAREQVFLGAGRTFRVNKDDIRRELGCSSLDGQPWNEEAEKKVVELRDSRILEHLRSGRDVVSDDTNLAPKHERVLRNLAKQAKADFEVNSTFLGVPIEECIRRDSLRPDNERVGKDVIWDMWNKFLRPPTEVKPMKKYEQNNYLIPAVICDLDGTLCLHNGRGPFDYDKCDTDLINRPVEWILTAVERQHGAKIIFLSGREDVARAKTQAWLDRHGFLGSPLFMRKAKDFRKDNIVKYELFDQHVRNDYNVLFVLDDRDQVVKMWRELGLTCLQVAPGNF